MGILDKVRNLFTEEVEEVEEKPIKKETRSVETVLPKRETPALREEPLVQAPKTEDSREKFVFPVYFDDKDFDDLEKPKEKPKKETKVKVEPYQGAKTNVVSEPKKVFKPSPIISPVYGVLDKNYRKDDITTKQEAAKHSTTYKKENLTIDDIRNKAYGTLEDDLEGSLLGNIDVLDSSSKKETVDNQDALDMFNDLDFDTIDEKSEKLPFDSLEKKVLMETDDLDDDTEQLARQLEEQKKKLEEINQYMNANEVSEKEENEQSSELEDDILEENIDSEVEFDDSLQQKESLPETQPSNAKKDDKDLNDSELFDLIDSMYEKRDEE